MDYSMKQRLIYFTHSSLTLAMVKWLQHSRHLWPNKKKQAPNKRKCGVDSSARITMKMLKKQLVILPIP